jgi:hypothetical protein
MHKGIFPFVLSVPSVAIIFSYSEKTTNGIRPDSSIHFSDPFRRRPFLGGHGIRPASNAGENRGRGDGGIPRRGGE